MGTKNLPPQETGTANDEPSFDELFALAATELETGEKPEVKEEPAPEPEPEEEPLPEAAEKKEVVEESKADPFAEALKAQTEAIKALVPKPEPKKEEPKEEPAAVVLDELSAEELEKFKADWPEVHALLVKKDAVDRANMEKLIAKGVAEALAPFKGQIEGLSKTIVETEQDKFISAVETAHPGAVQLIPEVEKWIESLPKYLQAGANHTLDNGSAADVIALYDDFKKATGKVEEPKKEEPPPPKVDEHKIASMEAVRTARTGVAETPDPHDFDGAFQEAAAKFATK